MLIAQFCRDHTVQDQRAKIEAVNVVERKFMPSDLIDGTVQWSDGCRAPVTQKNDRRYREGTSYVILYYPILKNTLAVCFIVLSADSLRRNRVIDQ